jgi:hypothetical protein
MAWRGVRGRSVGTAKSVGRAPSGGDAAGADLRQMHAELGEEPVSEDAVRTRHVCARARLARGGGVTRAGRGR